MENLTYVAQKLINEFRIRGDMDAKDIVDTILRIIQCK